MATLPLVLSLVAAVLHAAWNTLVKTAVDRVATMGLISLGHVIPALVLVALVPLPSMEALPYIVASTVIHWCYYIFLVTAYRHGDLSFVYPIARGLSPVLVATSAVFFAGEDLPIMAWAGIIIVSGGILMLAAVRSCDPRALGAAAATSIAIAAYSVVDGIGIRLSGSPFGYIGWLFTAEISVVAFVAAIRFRVLLGAGRAFLLTGFAGGVMSGVAYALVLVAKTLAPLGMVSAIRETSVVITALIGTIWLGERPVLRRLAAAACVGMGIALLSGS